jgi:thiol-disulfide isomerase/thioredoxin
MRVLLANASLQPVARSSRWLLSLTLLCMTAFSFADQTDSASLAWKGTDFSGAEIDFPAVLDGKPTVMVFWATWCPYCRAFMPHLGEIQNDYGDEKINILTIDVFEDGELDPAEYVDSLGFPMIAVADGDPVAELYSVRFTPGLMVLDGEGNVVWIRESTDLPPGEAVAEFWAGQVREQLDELL